MATQSQGRTATGELEGQTDHLPNSSGYAGDVGPSTGPAHGHDQGHVGGQHIVGLPTYFTVFGALMVLLIITLGAAAVDFAKLLGPRWHFLNIAIAMLIAVIKAVLIIAYFMHVKYSSKMTMVFAAAAFVFVTIMFALTFSDYQTRGWMPMAGK